MGQTKLDQKNGVNVLEFPLTRAAKKRLFKMKLNSEKNKVALGASLVSVILVSIFTNQFLLKKQVETIIDGRGIASVDSSRSVESIQFEHEFAKKISNSQGASLANKVSALDHLMFDYLQGRYAIEFNNEGGIKNINLSNESARPLAYNHSELIKTLDSFLPRHTQTKLIKVSPNLVLYSLMQGDQKVQDVELTLDQKGQLIQMKVY